LIPFDYITEWRTEAPWAQDSQVEQDLILTRAVVEIFSQPAAAASLAFRGGTALYKIHLRPPSRYSEDIDLVQVVAGPIGPVIDAIRSVIDPWLGKPSRTIKEGRVVLVYRMTSEGQPSIPMRLKIEINSREHFSVFGIEKREFAIHSRWFTGTTTVKTYCLDELLGTKLRALYQRKKGRDMFDLWLAGTKAQLDPQRIVDCFVRYLDHDGLRVSRAEFEANLYEKLSDNEFTTDVIPMLAFGIHWDSITAGKYIFEKVAPLLPGEPWKGPQTVLGMGITRVGVP
jgi:predicted nucleotidyltransferase component of viral defense system